MALQCINKKSAEIGYSLFGPGVLNFGAAYKGPLQLGNGKVRERGQVAPNNGQRGFIGDVDGEVLAADATSKGSVTRHCDNNKT